jgi:hypothetical protein
LSTYRGDTNTLHHIELPSSIEQIVWSRAMASPGGEVALGVFTRFIGNGAELQIELSDNSGKQIATLKEKLAGNRFWTSVIIPENARDALFADVKLQKHGLSKRSPALVLTPPVKITDVKWDKEEIHRGEKATLTAMVEGVPDGMEAEISIWENDEDGAHELVTKFPVIVRDGQIEAEWEFEYTGNIDEDIACLEDYETDFKTPNYFFRVTINGINTESNLLAFKGWIGIELVDSVGNTVPHERFILLFTNGLKIEGTLDENGRAVVMGVEEGSCTVFFPNFEEED